MVNKKARHPTTKQKTEARGISKRQFRSFLAKLEKDMPGVTIESYKEGMFAKYSNIRLKNINLTIRTDHAEIQCTLNMNSIRNEFIGYFVNALNCKPEEIKAFAKRNKVTYQQSLVYSLMWYGGGVNGCTNYATKFFEDQFPSMLKDAIKVFFREVEVQTFRDAGPNLFIKLKVPERVLLGTATKVHIDLAKKRMKSPTRGGDTRTKYCWNEEALRRYSNLVDDLKPFWIFVKDFYDDYSEDDWMPMLKESKMFKSLPEHCKTLTHGVLAQVANANLRKESRQPLSLACEHARLVLGVAEYACQTLRAKYSEGRRLRKSAKS